MPSTYQPRSPRASPLWQLVHHGWAAFLAHYEKRYRKDLGSLDSRPATSKNTAAERNLSKEILAQRSGELHTR